MACSFYRLSKTRNQQLLPNEASEVKRDVQRDARAERENERALPGAKNGSICLKNPFVIGRWPPRPRKLISAANPVTSTRHL